MLRAKVQAQVMPLRDILTLVSGTLLALSVTLLVNGCAERSTVHAESKEVPLTSGDGNHSDPCFSPDGSQVAYTTRDGMRNNTIHLVGFPGGEASPIIRQSGPLRARGWTGDGQSLLVSSYEDSRIQRLTLSGEILPGPEGPEFSMLAKISKEGDRALWCKIDRDNCDLVVQNLDDSDLDTVAVTPEWEIDSCFGPGEGDITFVRAGSYKAPITKLFVRTLATGAEDLLPLPEGRIKHPTWSPDRRYLAYISDNSGNNELWIYQAENQRSVQLTTTPEAERNPDWSPDGEWIVFSRSTSTSKLFLGDPRTYDRRPLTTGKGRDFSPRVSPDARWTAFFREYPATLDKASRTFICVAANETGEVRELDLGDLTPMVQELGICWSPDASEIAFPADDGSGNFDIYRLSREGGIPQRVTIEPGLDLGPAWSPDGTQIAYSRLAGDRIQIWTVPASGGIPRRITKPEKEWNHFLPVWAPDSDRLAYSRISVDSPKGIELWVVSTRDPSQTLRVVEGKQGNYADSWTRDGEQILALRMEGEEEFAGFLVQADGSGSTKLGRFGKDEKEHFLVLNKDGQDHFDLVYPGGIHVFSDGEQISNIYAIQVSEIIEARLSASGEEF